MGAKSYFENYLIREREPKIFVFMPSPKEVPKCKERLDNIIKPAAEDKELNLRIEPFDDDQSSMGIQERIFNGINTSRILLFDLSEDKRYGDNVNPNVMYELGIATKVRSERDIMIITDVKNIEKIPADVRSMNFIRIDSITKEDFKTKLKSFYDNQAFFEDKRINEVADSLDGICLEFILCFGLNPEGHRHFHDNGVVEPIRKLAVLRLLDLGLIYKPTDHTWWAYHWSHFGEAVIEKVSNDLRVRRRDSSAICNDLPEYITLLEKI